MLSGLCYPGWFVVPVFVLASWKKEDPFLFFHAVQGALVGALSSLFLVVVTFAVWILFHIFPRHGGAVEGLFGVALFSSIAIVGALLFCVMIFLGWAAASGRFLKLGPLGDFAENQMVKVLDLDYETLQGMGTPRELEAKGPVVLEPIPFPEAPSALGAIQDRLRSPEVVANLAQAKRELERPSSNRAAESPVKPEAGSVRGFPTRPGTAQPGSNALRGGYDSRKTELPQKPNPTSNRPQSNSGASEPSSGALPSAFRARETRDMKSPTWKKATDS